MKKILAILLASIMLLGILAACGDPAAEGTPTPGQGTGTVDPGPGSTDGPEDTGPQRPTEPKGQIVYGSTTEMNNIFNTSWPRGTIAVNMDIARLTQEGMATHAWTINDAYELNDVIVAKETAVVNGDGSKTYTFEIKQGLVFSDGTAITAANYVFSGLFYNSPEYGAIGGTTGAGMDLLGWSDYFTGETEYFAAYRLLGEYEFSVTIDGEALPFFFEESLVSTGPTAMHVYAPGVTVIDTPNGAKLSDEFTEDLIREHFSDEDKGQLFWPTVFSGAYVLTQYDPADSSAILDLNPNFPGNYDGTMPLISRIIIRHTPQATMMDMLETGEITLLPGIGGSWANIGLELVDEDIGIKATSWPRNGYGMIRFRNDFGPTSYPSVRRAIAYCLDSDEFARQFTHGHGIVVYGYYAAAMREYRENRDILDDVLNRYDFNVQNAIDELVADGWIYDADGGAFDQSSGQPRHKQEGDDYIPLIVKWFSTEGNAVSDLIAAMLVGEAAKAGIIIDQTIGDFPTLIDNLYEGDNPEFGMFNMALGFANVPYMHYYFSTDFDMWDSGWNADRTTDLELERISAAMMRTEPGDIATWDKYWVEFQIRFNEIMVGVPLYSDIYYDFQPEDLMEYNMTPKWQWAYAIRWAFFE